MTISTEDLLNSILASFDRIDYVKAEDIPNIDLYMDQVTTFMDNKMKKSTRKPDEDKILTKTMINNYAKNNLLPPPEKKKYSKEHMIVLIFIYYYKSILSISDIQKLLQPITDKYFKAQKGLKLEEIYEEVFSLEKVQIEALKKDVVDKFNMAQQTFEGESDETGEFLKQFAFICMLGFDVYMKKLLIEKLIDDMKLPAAPVKAKEKEKENKKSNK